MRKVGPAWSLQGRRKDDKLPIVPGPGTYSSKALSNTPSYSISRSNRHDFSKSPTSPGPGAYTFKVIDSAKATIFGSEPRMKPSTFSQVPGPGNYETKSLISEGPKYSLKGRVKLLDRTYSPGPGQYETNKSILENSFAHSFPKEQRSLSAGKDASPGPGTYEIRNNGGSGIKFGTETRGKTIMPNVPGPGSYNLPTLADNKGFSLCGRMPIKEIERSPGPGVYNTKPTLDQRSFSIGKSSRFKYKDNNVPGPGAYSLSSPKALVNSVIGHAKRETYLKSENSPGPGSYKIPEKIKEGPSFSMRPKTDVRVEERAPGPGQYTVKVVEKVAAPVFGTSKREKLAISDTPGPGQYATPVKEYAGWKFGNQQRLQYKASEVPGPGAYNYSLF